MGIFVNKDNSYKYNNVTLEDYDGLNGRHRMMIEACQDDMEMFSAMINYDVQEIDAMREGGDVQAVMENALTDAFSKFKEFLKKVWDKIKALIDALIARIAGFCAKDGKAFVKKYFTTAAKNVGEGKCKKIKFKVHEGSVFTKDKQNAKLSASTTYAASFSTLEREVVDKLFDDELDNADVKDKVLEIITDKKYSDYANYKKEYIEDKLGDLVEEEGIETTHLTKARSILESNKDTVAALKKEKSGADSAYRAFLRDVEQEEKKVKTGILDNKKEYSDDETRTTEYTKEIKKLGCRRTMILAYQECYNTGLSAENEIVKAQFADARKVISLAASATVRKANESFEEDFMLQEEAAFAVDFYMA